MWPTNEEETETDDGECAFVIIFCKRQTGMQTDKHQQQEAFRRRIEKKNQGKHKGLDGEWQLKIARRETGHNIAYRGWNEVGREQRVRWTPRQFSGQQKPDASCCHAAFYLSEQQNFSRCALCRIQTARGGGRKIEEFASVIRVQKKGFWNILVGSGCAQPSSGPSGPSGLIWPPPVYLYSEYLVARWLRWFVYVRYFPLFLLPIFICMYLCCVMLCCVVLCVSIFVAGAFHCRIIMMRQCFDSRLKDIYSGSYSLPRRIFFFAVFLFVFAGALCWIYSVVVLYHIHILFYVGCCWRTFHGYANCIVWS